MRNATEIVKHVDFSQARPAVQQQPASIDEGTAQVVNSLFNELKSIFPAWKQAWPDDEALKRAKRSWIKGLMAAGIHSLEQIRFGLMTCRASGQDFAPSVGKFVEWCQPTAEQLGLPPTEKAFQEAARNSHPAVGQGARWSHPAVHHAAMEAGLSNLFRLILLKKSVPSRPTCLKPEKCSIGTLLCEICSSSVPAMVRIST